MSRVLVVGDVVDDVLVRPVGATTAGSDTEADIDRQPGGSAANVAAWLGYAGTAVRFVGRAGREGTARHAGALASHGVDARVAADDTRLTAAIVLLVDPSGERTMYVDRGANAALTATDVPTDVWEDVSWLHLTGYTFFDPGVRPVATGLVARAAGLGIGVSVDPSSSAFLRMVGGDAFVQWVAGATLVTPNLDEAAALTGCDRPLDAARALLRRFGEVVVTCGPDGAVWCGRGADPLWSKAVSAPVVDSTGAGDAFCAGLLSSRTRGAGAAEQLAAGGRLAAEAVVRLGARPPASH